ncbi:hypothetical protein [Sanyastnella coralliicola]|uniref:hypothetical protein n=1 Tax=Sanyastnella coralliicola TaxID=3069118 RepID=UPI0027BA17FD|nr:hypothetical protein [Longitalea sp. SCSIO 12813]
MKRVLFLGLLTIIIGALGCAKNEEFVNPVYMCECGSVSWQGTAYPLQLAEYVQPDEDNFLSRRYYLTADIRLEGQTQPHTLAITLGTDSVDQVVQFIPADTVFNLVEEIDQNSQLLPYRTYVCTNGVVNFNPAFLGGRESVAFEMILRETIGTDTVGFDIPFSGSFNVTIQ